MVNNSKLPSILLFWLPVVTVAYVGCGQYVNQENSKRADSSKSTTKQKLENVVDARNDPEKILESVNSRCTDDYKTFMNDELEPNQIPSGHVFGFIGAQKSKLNALGYELVWEPKEDKFFLRKLDNGNK